MTKTLKTRHDELRTEAILFHAAHPEIWGLFQAYTFNRINEGFKHYSADAIFHRIRWETAKPDYKSGAFKLNDHYPSFYARAFMSKYPEHEGFFRTRAQTSKEKPALYLPPLGPSDFNWPQPRA